MLKALIFCALVSLGLPGTMTAQRTLVQVTKTPAAGSGREQLLFRVEYDNESGSAAKRGQGGFERALGISGGMPVGAIASTSKVGAFKLAAGLTYDTLWLTLVPASDAAGLRGAWDEIAEEWFLKERRAHVVAGTGTVGSGGRGARFDFAQFMDVEGIVREIVLPRLDHSVDDECSVMIAIVPDQVKTSWNPKVVAGNDFSVSRSGSACLVRNFTMTVGTLPTASAAMSPLSMQQVSESAGAGRDLVRTSSVRLSPIRIRIAAAEAAPWYAWYASFVIGGKNGRLDELPLRLALPGGAVRLNADVGIVSFRPTSENGVRYVDIELYGNLTKLQEGMPGVTGAGAPPAAVENTTNGTNTPPPEAAGSFRVNLPTAVLTGTGSVCSLGGAASAFVMQLDGPGGVGIIAGSGVRLRVGTFPVAADGEGTVRIGFTKSGADVVAYTAKSGTMTFTTMGERASGSFRVLADVTDVSNEAKEVEITGSFTNIPASC